MIPVKQDSQHYYSLDSSSMFVNWEELSSSDVNIQGMRKKLGGIFFIQVNYISRDVNRFTK